MSDVFDFPVSLGCRKLLCGGTHPCNKQEDHEGFCYCPICGEGVEG